MDQLEAVIYRFPVSAKIASPTEETGATPVIVDDLLGSGDAKPSERGFLRAARRDLTPDEAASAAGIRWIQYDLERLDNECSTLHRTIDQLRHKNDTLLAEFNDQRVELETLKASAKTSLRNEILANLCLAGGSAGLGAASGFVLLPAVHDFAVVVLIVSGVLFLGGILLRVFK